MTSASASKTNVRTRGVILECYVNGRRRFQPHMFEQPLSSEVAEFLNADMQNSPLVPDSLDTVRVALAPIYAN